MSAKSNGPGMPEIAAASGGPTHPHPASAECPRFQLHGATADGGGLGSHPPRMFSRLDPSFHTPVGSILFAGLSGIFAGLSGIILAVQPNLRPAIRKPSGCSRTRAAGPCLRGRSSRHIALEATSLPRAPGGRVRSPSSHAESSNAASAQRGSSPTWEPPRSGERWRVRAQATASSTPPSSAIESALKNVAPGLARCGTPKSARGRGQSDRGAERLLQDAKHAAAYARIITAQTIRSRTATKQSWRLHRYDGRSVALAAA